MEKEIIGLMFGVGATALVWLAVISVAKMLIEDFSETHLWFIIKGMCSNLWFKGNK